MKIGKKEGGIEERKKEIKKMKRVEKGRRWRFSFSRRKGEKKKNPTHLSVGSGEMEESKEEALGKVEEEEGGKK